MSIRVLIVDDHPVVRDGLRGMLDSGEGIDVVGEAVDGVECLDLVRRLEPDVVLMDLNMPRMDGIETLERIRETPWQGAVLVLSVRGGKADIMRALRSGASGYLMKDAARVDLIDGIKRTAERRPLVPAEVMATIVGEDTTTSLTDRELEIFRLVAAGHTNRSTGRQLDLAEATVKSHLVRAYAKLGVSDRASAIRRLHELGYM